MVFQMALLSSPTEEKHKGKGFACEPAELKGTMLLFLNGSSAIRFIVPVDEGLFL